MSEPAVPFVMMTMTAGITAANLNHLYAWLQCDYVHELQERPTKLALGADVAKLLSEPAILKVDATQADPELYPTGERKSPQDDLTLVVDRQLTELAADAVWLLQQQAPGRAAAEGA